MIPDKKNLDDSHDLIGHEYKALSLEHLKIPENEGNADILLDCLSMKDLMLHYFRKASNQEDLMKIRDNWVRVKEKIGDYLLAFDFIKKECVEDKNALITPWYQQRKNACQELLDNLNHFDEILKQVAERGSKRPLGKVKGIAKQKLFSHSLIETHLIPKQLIQISQRLRLHLCLGLDTERDLLLQAKNLRVYQQTPKP